MNDPWPLLGLDPNTANEKDIKVAYARLLKKHRPDVDPVGFRRVYDAYQSALEWLERSHNGRPQDFEGDDLAKKRTELPRSEVSPLASPDEKDKSLSESTWKTAPLEPAGTASNAPDFQEPAPKRSRLHTDSKLSGQDGLLKSSLQPPRVSGLQGYEGKLLELKRLLHGWHFPWSIQRAFDAVSRAFDGERVQAAKRSLEWRAVFDGDLERLARRMQSLALVSLVHLDEFSLCYDVVNQWHSKGKWKQMKMFGAALINCGARKVSPLAGDFIAFLSKRLAIAGPEIADRLASLAFLLLDKGERDQYANTIARDIWLGRQLSQIHGNYRHFWNVNLAHGAAPMAGTTYRLRRIVLDTVGLMPADWPGWYVVRERMTSELQVTFDRWIVSRKGSWEIDWLHLRDFIENIASSIERIAVHLGGLVLIALIALSSIILLLCAFHKLGRAFEL